MLITGGRIPSLDGIRAAFFMPVFLAHTGLIPLSNLPLYEFSIEVGAAGLSAFFFLSGYIITTLMRLEYSKTANVDVRNFYLRRAYRLMPSFFVVLVIAYGLQLAGFLRGTPSLTAFLAQVAQLTNYYAVLVPSNPMRATGTSIFWSLAVENHFYLVFPFLFLALMRIRSLPAMAVALAGLCLVVAFGRWYTYMVMGLSEGWILYTTHARFDSILAGCLMGLWRNPALDKVEPWGPVTSAIAAFFCLMIAVSILSIDLGGWEFVFGYTLQSMCFFVLFTAAITHADTVAFRWLNSRVMVYLGTISYTLYLCHDPILKLLKNNTALTPVLIASLGLAAAIAYSALSYRYLERPMNSLRKRLH